MVMNVNVHNKVQSPCLKLNFFLLKSFGNRQKKIIIAFLAKTFSI